MFDRELALDSVEKIKQAVDTIMIRAAEVEHLEELPKSSDGMLRLDALCMNLIVLGEAVKGLDKHTGGKLLPHYPEIYWQGVMRMRDKIAHHYFEIDTDVVFQTIREDIPPLAETINKMLTDIKEGLILTDSQSACPTRR